MVFSETPTADDLDEPNIARWLYKNESYQVIFDINRSWTKADLTAESLEGSWQVNNPGVPRYAIANSIKINVDYQREGNPITNLFTSTGTRYKTSASAHIEPFGLEVTSAPFAIPLCSLIDYVTNEEGLVVNSEIQSPENICKGDRLFTGAARYCTEDNPDCRIIPEFFWDPAENSAPDYMQATHSGGSGIWNNYHYADIADHFGVIGISSSSKSGASLTEAEIIAQLDQIYSSTDAGNLHKASVGDYFNILKEGLVTPEAETAIWNNIVQKVGNPAYTDTDLKDYQRNGKGTHWKNLPQTAGAYSYDHNQGQYEEPSACKFWDVGYGTCNSRRFYFPGERGTNMRAFQLDKNNSYLINYYSTLSSEGGASYLNSISGIFAQYKPTMTSSNSNDTLAEQVIEPFRSNPSNANMISAIQNSCFAFSYLYDFDGRMEDLLTPLTNNRTLSDANTYKYFTAQLRKITGGNPRDATVWKVKVPVIAQLGPKAKTCAGVKNATDPIPQIDPNIMYNKATSGSKVKKPPVVPYRVVGFVEVILYDVDIGYAPPMYPHIKVDPADKTGCDWSSDTYSQECRLCPMYWFGYAPCLSEGTTPAGVNSGWGSPFCPNGGCSNGCGTGEADSQFSNPFPPSDFATSSLYEVRQANPIIYPWGFSTNNVPDYTKKPHFAIDGNPAPPTNCNLVRARVACGTDFIASDVNSEDEPNSRRVVLRE